MVSITLSVPQETRELMNKFPEMNWSGFVRNSIESKVRELSWKEEMLEKLKLEEPIIKMALEMQRESRNKSIAELKRNK